jgi:hypothetical protein
MNYKACVEFLRLKLERVEEELALRSEALTLVESEEFEEDERATVKANNGEARI